jgi:hypothetical protein
MSTADITPPPFQALEMHIRDQILTLRWYRWSGTTAGWKVFKTEQHQIEDKIYIVYTTEFYMIIVACRVVI